MKSLIFAVLAIVGSVLAESPGLGQAKKKPESKPLYAVPSSFLTPNFSRTHPKTAPVKGDYFIPAEGRGVYFGLKGIYFSLGDDEFRLLFLGANEKVKIEARDQGNTVTSSGDSKGFDHTYRTLAFPDLWPGIDLVYWIRKEVVYYRIEVKPTAKIESIRLGFYSVKKVSIDPNGRLIVEAKNHRYAAENPLAYHLVKAKRKPVTVTLEVLPKAPNDVFEYRFQVTKRDPKKKLVITSDPKALGRK